MKINGGRSLTKYYCSVSCVLINTADLIICVTYTRRLKVFVWYLCLTATTIIILLNTKSKLLFLFPLLYMTKFEHKKFAELPCMKKRKKGGEKQTNKKHQKTTTATTAEVDKFSLSLSLSLSLSVCVCVCVSLLFVSVCACVCVFACVRVCVRAA